MVSADHEISQSPTPRDPRIEAIRRLILRLAAGDSATRATPSAQNDALDEIIVGLNRLADKLAALQAEIVERRQAEEAARGERELAEALRDAAAALNSTLDFDEVLDRILANLEHVVPHDMASVMLIKDESARVIKCRSTAADAALEESVLGKHLRIADVPDMVWMMQTGLPAVIPDTHAFVDWVDFPETQWIRSHISAPIRAMGQIIGFLSVDSATSNFFNARHGERLLAFADQAGIAIENARLFEETRRHANEAQRLYELSARLNSKLDFEAVLQLVADFARELSGAVDVRAIVRSGTEPPFYRSISACAPEELARVETVNPRPGGLTETIMRTGESLIIPNMAADPRVNPQNLARGMRSQMGIPIRVGEQVIGALFAHSNRLNAFDAHDQELVSFLANQAGIALENARLFREMEGSLAITTRLYQLSAQILTATTLEKAARLVTETVRAGLGADASSIALVDSQGNLEFRYASGLSETFHQEAKMRPDGTAMRAIKTGQPVIVTDPEQMHPRVRAEGIQSLIALPLRAEVDHLGILYLNYRHLRTFTEHEVKLLSVFANQSALALANARLRETLREQAIRDPLTGLFNRRYMEEMLERELHRAARHQVPLGVLMIDIDHFKEFNDTFGHLAGDQVLREIGAGLPKLVRAEDVICRFGGEEFLAILPEASLEDAVKRAEQIRAKVKETRVHFEEQALQVTVSVGVAVFPQHGRTAEAIVHAADAALYRGKQEGRDRVIVA